MFVSWVLATVGLAGCDDASAAHPGLETGACIDAACFGTLQCLSNLCVDPDWGPAASSGTGGAAGEDDDDGASDAPDSGDPTGGDSDEDEPGDDTDGGSETGAGSDSGAGSDTSATTTGDSTGDPTGDPTGGPTGGSGGGSTGDPSFPDPATGCPANTIDGNTALQTGFNVCLPLCNTNAADVVSACPQPSTGTALGACVLSEETVGETCGVQGTPANGESCGGGRFCLSTGGGSVCVMPSACGLICPSGATCPDGMVCNAHGILRVRVS